MSFTNYEQDESSVEPRVLTDDEKQLLTDEFATSKSITEIKHEHFIPTSLIKQSFAKKKTTEAFIVKLLRGQVIESIDDEGVISYKEAPTVKAALISIVKAEFPDCTVVDYNVNSFLVNATSTGTLAALRAAL